MTIFSKSEEVRFSIEGKLHKNLCWLEELKYHLDKVGLSKSNASQSLLRTVYSETDMYLFSVLIMGVEVVVNDHISTYELSCP